MLEREDGRRDEDDEANDTAKEEGALLPKGERAAGARETKKLVGRPAKVREESRGEGSDTYAATGSAEA